jgi:hypothetical protein
MSYRGYSLVAVMLASCGSPHAPAAAPGAGQPAMSASASPGVEPVDVPSVESTCQPEPGAKTHCIVVTLHPSSESKRDELQRRWRAEGLDATLEGEKLALWLSDEQIQKVWGARVIYRRTERSSGPGTICEADLVWSEIPVRFRADVESISIGHQICE